MCRKGLIHRVPKLTLTFDPRPKINRIPPPIIHNLHVKIVSDWGKTVFCILSTRSYTQSATVDLDLWPRDPKSIGFLLSSSITYMWILKVIWRKISRYRVLKIKGHGRTEARTHSRIHSLTQPPTNGRITMSHPTLLRGDKNVKKHPKLTLIKTSAFNIYIQCCKIILTEYDWNT